jgi:hypothetical protein
MKKFHSEGSDLLMWFTYDGMDFETHDTEEKAKAVADDAMQSWRGDAEDGWDECADQVCYGKITHYVKVDSRVPTEDELHFLPSGCEIVEEHTLVKDEE